MASFSVRNENDEEYVEYLVPYGKKMDTVKIILNGLPDSRTILNGCVIDEQKYILYGSTRETLWILTCQNNYYEIGKYDTASGIYTKQFELPAKAIWNNLMDPYGRMVVIQEDLVLFDTEKILIFPGGNTGGLPVEMPFYKNDILQLQDYDSTTGRIILWMRLDSDKTRQWYIISDLDNYDTLNRNTQR
jgi:hypothetical protein